jgi:hypothetical protein
MLAARRVVGRRSAPAIRSDRAPSRLDAGEPVQKGDELAIGQGRRRFAGDLAMAVVTPVAFRDLSRQAFVDGPWTEDQQVVARGQPVRDVSDESVQVFDPMRLAGRLRAPAAVTDGGIVPDMTGCPVMSRHRRFHSIDVHPVAPHPDDEGVPGVDPDKRGRSTVDDFRSHERAHAGPSSASSARSA